MASGGSRVSPTLLAAGCGAVVGLGVLVIVVPFCRPGPVGRPQGEASKPALDPVPIRAAAAIGAALVAHAATGWFTVAFGAGAAD